MSGENDDPVFKPADFDFRPRTRYAEPQKEEAIFYIETEKIHPNPQQPRREFDESRLLELADSIREHGVLQPLVATKIETEMPTGTKVEYQLIAGERRLLAAKMAGLLQVPVIIRKTPSDAEKLELALIENIQREDLNVIERARAFEKLINEFNFLQKDIARRVGKSRESISNTLRLLNLPLEIQKALEERQINEGHARVILTLTNPEKQRALYYAVVQNGLSVREAQELAENFGRRRTFAGRKNVEPEIQMIEDRLEEILGAKVSVNKKGDKGKIQIAFYSREELMEIANRILIAGPAQTSENNPAENANPDTLGDFPQADPGNLLNETPPEEYFETV
ncbi:MAG: ParB/RepB/Spo0J family partition protein [bacterium]|nr:ParB/RepB/Spo0J family partition protein [bacterium]